GPPAHRRDGARGLPRLHRHARALRTRDPRRAPARAESPPGHHHRADRRRRQLVRAVPLARRLPPVRADELRPRRQPTAARALVHRGAVPRHVHRARGRERGLHRRQLAAANRRARLGRPARDALANMKALLRTAMEEGAFGMSTGLDYPPGSYADTAELTELSREAARLGGIYHTHVRYSLGDRFLDPFREALDIGRGSDIPVHITHFYHRTTSPGGASRMLDLVEEARESGLDVTFDSYPYNLSSTRLL